MSQLVELCNRRAERGVQPLTLRNGRPGRRAPREEKPNSRAGVPLGEEGMEWAAHPGQRDMSCWGVEEERQMSQISAMCAEPLPAVLFRMAPTLGSPMDQRSGLALVPVPYPQPTQHVSAFGPGKGSAQHTPSTSQSSLPAPGGCLHVLLLKPIFNFKSTIKF